MKQGPIIDPRPWPRALVEAASALCLTCRERPCSCTDDPPVSAERMRQIRLSFGFAVEAATNDNPKDRNTA